MAPSMYDVKLVGRPPQGVQLSAIWKDPGGVLVRHDGEAPVDEDDNLVGEIASCPIEGCTTAQWVFDAPNPERKMCCPQHPQELIRTRPDGALNSADEMVAEASRSVHEIARRILAERRDRAVAMAKARAEELQSAALAAAERKVADVRRHVPTVAASAATVLASEAFAATHPLAAAAVGAGLVAAAPVVLVGARAVANRHTRRTLKDVAALGPMTEAPDDLSPDLKAKRERRWFSRQEAMVMGSAARITTIAAGTPLATGLFLMTTSAMEIIPLSLRVALSTPLGAALAWSVWRRQWEELSLRRRKDLASAEAAAAQRAKLAAEEAERLRLAAELANAITEEPPEVEGEALMMGRAFAARWQEVIDSPDVTIPFGFRMADTWVVPEETKPVTVPGEDGEPVQVGWEYTVKSKKGALVASGATTPPAVAAQGWLKAVLYPEDDSVITVVDSPVTPAVGDEPAVRRFNTLSVLVTQGMPLAATVPYRGAAGIRHHRDGGISAFIGRTQRGVDVYERIYTPGQPGGSLLAGTTGGGKTGRILGILLNWLYAGIFPLLFDPKGLRDLADFVGVIPIACTPEQRMAFLEFLTLLRTQRDLHLTSLPRKDRLGRERSGEAVWDVQRDGPLVGYVIDEYSECAMVPEFKAMHLALVRVQRTAAMLMYLASQAGGVKDWGSTELRMLIGTLSVMVFRMSQHHAQLAGYAGQLNPMNLPPLPGTALWHAPDEGETALRVAYVPRTDTADSCYDHLYGPDNKIILGPPELPDYAKELMVSTGVQEIWDAGKGPGGVLRVAGGLVTPEPARLVMPDGSPTPSTAATTTERLTPQERILVLAWMFPGATCSELREKPILPKVWGYDCTGERKPALTTFTRPAGECAKANPPLLVSEETKEGIRYTITPEGRAVVAKYARQFRLPTQPTQAELEARAEEDEENEDD